jgi:hypothetical protein
VSYTVELVADKQNDLVLGYVAGELLRQFGPMMCASLPGDFQVSRSRLLVRYM